MIRIEARFTKRNTFSSCRQIVYFFIYNGCIRKLWKSGEEESPISFEVISINKKWKISDEKIDASYELKLNVEDFLSKEMTKDFNGVMKKLQEAKSDGIGFGRQVRAFHPALWEKGDWQDTFSELPINVKVKVKITRTGVLN